MSKDQLSFAVDHPAEITRPQCGDCRYFTPSPFPSNEKQMGTCRIDPARIVEFGRAGVWPEIAATEVACGRYVKEWRSTAL